MIKEFLSLSVMLVGYAILSEKEKNEIKKLACDFLKGKREEFKKSYGNTKEKECGDFAKRIVMDFDNIIAYTQKNPIEDSVCRYYDYFEKNYRNVPVSSEANETKKKMLDQLLLQIYSTAQLAFENYYKVLLSGKNIQEINKIERNHKSNDEFFESLRDNTFVNITPELSTTINSEDYCVIVDKDVVVSKNVDCKGKLAFIKCNIVFENDGNIDVGQYGALAFINCTVRVNKDCEHQIIYSSGEVYACHVIFDSVVSGFSFDGKTTIESCEFIACREICVGSDILRGKSSIDGCKFTCGFKEEESSCHFNDYDSCLKIGDVTITNSRFESIGKSNNFSIVKCENNYNSVIENCTFVGAKNCIYCEDYVRLNKCYFESCENAIILTKGIEKPKPIIKNSYFVYCKDVIHVSCNCIVHGCKFIKCKDQMITCIDVFSFPRYGLGNNISMLSYKNGGIEVRNSIFSDIAFNDNDGNCNRGIIVLSRYGGKKSKVNLVDNCVFDGICINNGYLIKIYQGAPSADEIEESDKRGKETKIIASKNIVAKIKQSSFNNYQYKNRENSLIQTQLLLQHIFKGDEPITMAKIVDCDTYPRKGQQCSDYRSAYLFDEKEKEMVGSCVK